MAVFRPRWGGGPVPWPVLGWIRSALYRESLVWLILLSFGSVERGQTAECKKCSKWLKYKTLIPDFSSWIDSQCWTACQVCSGWTPRPDPLGVVQGEAGVTDPEVMHFHKEKSCLFHSLQIFLNWLFMFLLAARRYIWATESRNLLKQTPNVWIIKYDTCPIFHPEFTPKAGQHVRHSQGGLIGRIQSALYTEDLALLDLDVMRVYGKETTD